MSHGVSEVQICNMALSHVGSKSTIEIVGEDNRPGKVCELWYAPARWATLEAYNWSFARKRLALAEHSVAAPTERWAYRYQYPADCVKMRLIENPLGDEADAIPFTVEEADADTSSILTDQEDAVGIYTRDVSTTSRFTMHFILMFSYRLGLFIESELTGKLSRRQSMQREFNQLKIEAPVTDSEESVPKEDRDASWIRART